MGRWIVAMMTNLEVNAMISGRGRIVTRSLAMSGWCLVALAAAPLCAELPSHRDTAVMVSPADEITILDPGTNSLGKPSPIVTGADGVRHVDIPPTVIVHNYYYTGDRDFRGPSFPGGPSVVVVSHPATGERQYLEVQMLPGSPRITYRKSYIDYNFGERRIRVRFKQPLHPFDRNAVTVAYGDGDEDDLEPSDSQPGHVSDWIHRTGVPDAVRYVATGTHNALDTTADRFRDAGELIVAPVVRLIDATPLGGLVSSAEERAQRSRDAGVRRAEQLARETEGSIPTLR